MTISPEEYDRILASFEGKRKNAEKPLTREEYERVVASLKNPVNARAIRAKVKAKRIKEQKDHQATAKSNWPFKDLPRGTSVTFKSGGLPTLGKRR
jgi:hypothetical protein